MSESQDRGERRVAEAPSPLALEMSEKEARTWALLAHVLSLAAGFIGPLIVYLVKKDESEFVAQHAKEALNFQISVMLGSFVCAVLMLFIVGFFMLMGLAVLNIVFIIQGAIRANEGGDYRYPLSLRVVT